MSRWDRLDRRSPGTSLMAPGSLAWRQAEAERRAMDAELAQRFPMRTPGALPGRGVPPPLGRRAMAGSGQVEQMLATGQEALRRIMQLRRQTDGRIARWNHLATGSAEKLAEARALAALLSEEVQLHQTATQSVQSVVQHGRSMGTASATAQELMRAIHAAGAETAQDLAELQGYVQRFAR